MFVFFFWLAYKDCDSSDASDPIGDKDGNSSAESMAESDESADEDDVDFFGLKSKTEVTS